MIVDLQALEQQARDIGSEIAWRKLLPACAAGRTTIAAVCLVPNPLSPGQQKLLTAAGFQVECVRATPGAAVAASWIAAAGAADCVVVAPWTDATAKVVTRAPAGVRMEAASFDGKATTDLPARQLGRECLFIP